MSEMSEESERDDARGPGAQQKRPVFEHYLPPDPTAPRPQHEPFGVERTTSRNRSSNSSATYTKAHVLTHRVLSNKQSRNAWVADCAHDRHAQGVYNC